jgi:hypothetical protein
MITNNNTISYIAGAALVSINHSPTVAPKFIKTNDLVMYANCFVARELSRPWTIKSPVKRPTIFP